MNNSTVGQRIRKLRKANKLTQAELAKIAGVSSPAVTEWEKDSYLPKAASLSAMAEYFHVTTDYILYGTEPKDGTPISDVKLVEYDDIVEVPFYEEIPASCGTGRLVEGLPTNSRMIPIRREILSRYKVNQFDVKAFPSDGKSMVPTIQDKAVVFVDMSRKRIIDEKIFAVCHGGLFKFKQLFNLPLGGVRIVSANAEEHPEEKLTKEQIKSQEFEVVGYAFWVEQGLP